MSEERERREGEKRAAEGVAFLDLGHGTLPCRVIERFDAGFHVRVDGMKASRSLVGKRASVAAQDAKAVEKDALHGRVVWVRPAVNGVYLGIEVQPEVRPSAASASSS